MNTAFPNRRIRPPTRAANARKAFGPLLKGQDGFRILLFVLTILTISRIHAHLGLSALRPALVLAAGTLAYALMNPRVVHWNGLFRHWPSKVIAALAVVACLSAAFGISLGSAARFIVEEFSKVLVFAALLIVAQRKASDVRLIVAAYVISTGILVYYTLFVFKMSATNTGMMRLSGLYTYDANDVGLMMLVGVPLALWLFESVKAHWKLVITILLLGVGIGIARSGSRGAFVGGVALVGALLVFVRHVALEKRLAVVAVIGVGIVITSPPGYWDQMATILSPKEDYNWTSSTGRKAIAERGMGYMWDYPVFGIGAGNFGRAEGMISDLAQNHMPGTGLKWTAPHNSYVQIGAELGLTGLLLWISLILGGIIGMLMLRRRIPRAWARGDPEQRFLFSATMYLPAAYVAFAVPAGLLSFAYLDPIYLLSAIYCGVHTATYRRLSIDRAAAARSPLSAVPGTNGHRFPPSGQPGVPAPIGGRQLA